VSEGILNDTSAPLGYTVIFTLAHAGKYRTEDKLNIPKIHKNKHNSEKTINTKYTKIKLPYFSRLI